jgi:hypothetical protein
MKPPRNPQAEHGTGMIRPVEPTLRHEPPQPPTLPEFPDDEASTGQMRAITEGRDRKAAGDNDARSGI